MTFSAEWDQRFRANQNISIWPWSDLVSYVNRYARPADGYTRVLELGCGAGANIPFFTSLPVDYFAIEGSASIVARLHHAHPGLRDRIVVGDFTQALPFAGPFDLVIDRSAVTHNTTDAICRTLVMIFDRLRTGGKFIGIDWFSTAHQDAQTGDALDAHTRANLRSGQFAGVGAVHFSDENHIIDLLTRAGFRVDLLEKKDLHVVHPKGGCGRAERVGMWHFVAVKP
jgi:SAM-dependent methyltransferase